MVKVIGKNSAMIKETTCSQCASKLEYTNSEAKTRSRTDYTGDTSSWQYIECPECKHEVIVDHR